MTLKQLDEVFYRFRIKIELGGISSHSSEPFRGARVFHLRCQEIQENEVDMLQLISARFHKLAGNHAVRHVPADTHSAPMSRFDNSGNEFRFQ